MTFVAIFSWFSDLIFKKDSDVHERVHERNPSNTWEKSKVKKQWFYCCHCEIFNDE